MANDQNVQDPGLPQTSSLGTENLWPMMRSGNDPTVGDGDTIIVSLGATASDEVWSVMSGRQRCCRQGQ